MSGQHWIDVFFRKRMKDRDFPVEAGEFEEMRALLEQRNTSTSAVRGAGLSKWWLSILIPVAGLLWWNFGEISSGSDEHFTSTSEDEVINGRFGGEQPTHAPNKAIAHLEAASSLTEDVAEFDDHGGTATNLGTRAAQVNDPSTRSVGDVRAAQGAVVSTPGPDGVMDTPGQEGMDPNAENADGTRWNDRGGEREALEGTHARANDRAGTSPSDQHGIRPDQVSMDVRVVDERSEPQGVPVALPVQAEVNDTADDLDHSPVSEELKLLSARSVTDDATLIQPRWSMPVVASSPEPIRRDVPVFKRIPTGELHVFGAPLLVRTRSRVGGRSGAEAGSLVGLEYRVRSGRISWATGVRYGSYTLTADQGATDVTLSFVELPLLAIVQQGWGRFGASIQGGLSVDLLFNASGRYPLGDRAANVFPEGAFRTANCSWSLRPQAIYRLNEHLSVNAGPLWKAQIGEVAKEGALDGAKVSSAGLAIGVTWRLERSTF